MTATNDFLPFAVGGAANVETQAAYAADTTTLQSGFASGIAQSIKLNKVWRQSSIMAAVLAQFAADYSGNNSTDDGTTATLEANLVAAIRSATKTGVILADTGAANAYTAVNAPPLVAGTWVDGVVQQIRIAHANTGASTYAPDGLTAIPIYGLGLQPLQGGELALNGVAILMRMTIAGVNSGNPIAVLMECAGGAQQVAPATASQHAMQLGQATGRLLNTQIFTTSGTYIPTPGISTVIMEVQGAGGGSGGAPATGSGGFSGSPGAPSGTYAMVKLTAAQIGVSQSVTIGSGGTAGPTGAGTGGTGGTTQVGSLVSCPGGVGSTSYGPTSSTVVVATVPSVSASPTVNSGTVIILSQGNVGSPAVGTTAGGVISGPGGSSPINRGTNGPGAGGSGQSLGASSSAIPGLVGGVGKVIFWEYA